MYLLLSTIDLIHVDQHSLEFEHDENEDHDVYKRQYSGDVVQHPKELGLTIAYEDGRFADSKAAFDDPRDHKCLVLVCDMLSIAYLCVDCNYEVNHSHENREAPSHILVQYLTADTDIEAVLQSFEVGIHVD